MFYFLFILFKVYYLISNLWLLENREISIILAFKRYVYFQTEKSISARSQIRLSQTLKWWFYSDFMCIVSYNSIFYVLYQILIQIYPLKVIVCFTCLLLFKICNTGCPKTDVCHVAIWKSDESFVKNGKRGENFSGHLCGKFPRARRPCQLKLARTAVLRCVHNHLSVHELTLGTPLCHSFLQRLVRALAFRHITYRRSSLQFER